MRVWVDLTNSPHPLVLRPVVERLRAAGHDVEVTARDFAQTVELARAARAWTPTVIGRHRGGAARGEGARARVALARRSRAGRAGARFDLAIGHGSNDVTRRRGRPADPVRDDVRLRVGERSSTSQLPPRPRRGRSRRDPAGAPAPATARPRKLAPLSGAQGGVLPRRLRAGPGGARRAWPRRARADRRRAHAARRSRCTTASRTSCSPRCSSACAARRRSCCRGSRPSARELARGRRVHRARRTRSTPSR